MIKSLFRALAAVIVVQASEAIPAPSATSSPETETTNPNFGPVPGLSQLFDDYTGLAPPFPANVTKPVPATAIGNPAPDDALWQNLLAAEWIIYSFYQLAVTTFNASSFTTLGLPNNTFQRVTEIRDNEAGHLRIFQDKISRFSVKPGACEYDFPLDGQATNFLALSTLIEIASMVFLTGLVQEARDDTAKGALTAISQVETRHEIWSLLEVWGVDPFGGPSDTVFPYPNEILDITNRFVVPGSCPHANPPFPNPSQNLPRIGIASWTDSVTVGSTVQLNFTDPDNQPHFEKNAEYYAVFFHGVDVISAPLVMTQRPEQPPNATIPAEFEAKGVVIMVIATMRGAPTLSSVVAGPAIFLQQPAELGIKVI